MKKITFHPVKKVLIHYFFPCMDKLFEEKREEKSPKDQLSHYPSIKSRAIRHHSYNDSVLNSSHFCQNTTITPPLSPTSIPTNILTLTVQSRQRTPQPPVAGDAVSRADDGGEENDDADRIREFKLGGREGLRDVESAFEGW